MSEIQLNNHGVNSNIKANILEDERMREIGFTDYSKENWYFRRNICFPKEKQYKYFRVSFNVSIPKDGSDIRIDVLDDDFLQPYDYQKFLSNNPKFEPALIVCDQVEQWMDYLQNHGVLSGHVRGEYI